MTYESNGQNSNSSGNVYTNHIGPAYYKEATTHAKITSSWRWDCEGLETLMMDLGTLSGLSVLAWHGTWENFATDDTSFYQVGPSESSAEE